jgi:hypothetical protein
MSRSGSVITPDIAADPRMFAATGWVDRTRVSGRRIVPARHRNRRCGCCGIQRTQAADCAPRSRRGLGDAGVCANSRSVRTAPRRLSRVHRCCQFCRLGHPRVTARYANGLRTAPRALTADRYSGQGAKPPLRRSPNFVLHDATSHAPPGQHRRPWEVLNVQVVCLVAPSDVARSKRMHVFDLPIDDRAVHVF